MTNKIHRPKEAMLNRPFLNCKAVQIIKNIKVSTPYLITEVIKVEANSQVRCSEDTLLNPC